MAAALALGAVGPAQAYIDPGTGSMLLQMIGAGIAGAIFYFRELRMKLIAMFTRRGATAAEDGSDAPSGDAPR
ncbi:MAG: hypothetical protein FJ171_01895 [Gammaproteobacteria bacterium]|nr:hypothetical protein [Gammaproteobacteria bacterium]